MDGDLFNISLNQGKKFKNSIEKIDNNKSKNAGYLIEGFVTNTATNQVVNVLEQRDSNKDQIDTTNQKNEAHCDLVGIDLAFGAGYAVCDNVKLWERMSLDEDSDNIMGIFSSHPYSIKRSDCSKRHIESTYNLKCPK